jgi:hypothetical protein
MTTDDEIPEHDPLAESARRALQRMAATDAVEVAPWSAIEARGRRQKQLRMATAIAASVIVLAGATAAVTAATGRSDHVTVAAPNVTTTSTTPASSTLSSAPTTPPPNPPPVGCVDVTCGTIALPTPTPAALPAETAPGPNDFTGTVTLQGKGTTTWSMTVGDRVAVDVEVRNVTDRMIAPSDSRQPTAVATVCTSDDSGAHSLWWMTNVPMAPGASSGRSGSFEPTDQYLGTVHCEVVIVTTDTQGTTFDANAGGDEARARILATVAGIPPVVITVQPAPATTTTTTAPATTTTGP